MRDQDIQLRSLQESLAAFACAASDQRVLYLEARAGAHWPWPKQAMVCVQRQFPLADALRLADMAVAPTVDALPDEAQAFDVVLLLPDRQRDYNRARLLDAALKCRPGGQIVLAAENQQGAASLEKDVRALFANARVWTKHKCRALCVLNDPARFDQSLAGRWRAAAAIKRNGASERFECAGIFNGGALDAGSAELIQHLPDPGNKAVADLGAGSGLLAQALLARGTPALIDLYEADALALHVARLNFSDSKVPLQFLWADVTAGLSARYDLIVSNPPFHTSRPDRPELGNRFIEVAAAALKRDGSLYMVANRHLPYEEMLHYCFERVSLLSDAKGFKVFAAFAPKKERMTKVRQ